MTVLPKVLLIGAAGVFGSRLARLLAAEGGLVLVLAGRRGTPLAALAAELGALVETAILDRHALTAEDLTALGVDLVIDAAGPFQLETTAVVAAAIGAGCHYIDLSDGRAFVGGIGRFDAEARDAGVLVVSGASTTPTLTHAVIEDLTAGWRRIDTLRAWLSPGNRAPRGLSVVQAVLSYAGQPVRVFREGAWTTAPGWGLTHRVALPGLGTRWGSLCETADLDLMAARFRPRVAAEFFAGVELGALHLGLVAGTRLVRWGVCKSLLPFAGPLHRMLRWFEPFGSDRGGMMIEAKGVDATGTPAIARWSLVADGGRGPTVPTLAALALVRLLREGAAGPPGARPCVGILRLADFADDFVRLDIRTRIERTRLPVAAFAAALGREFQHLPAITQAIHLPDPVCLLHGEADVDGAETTVGSWLSRLFQFPTAASAVPITTVIELDGTGTERWSRVYPTRVLRTRIACIEPGAATVEESFGRCRFRLGLVLEPDGMRLDLIGGRIGPLPLPKFLLPDIRARETADGDRHRFDVSISLPLIGRLVRYRGWLKIADAPPPPDGLTEASRLKSRPERKP